MLASSWALMSSQPALASRSGLFLANTAKHPGHRMIGSHPFLQDLRKGRFRAEQVAQYFQDRVYLLKYFESTLDWYGNDFPGFISARQKEILYRSSIYQNELKKLNDSGIQTFPSPEVRHYVQYLKEKSHDIIFFHFLLGFIEESFRPGDIGTSIHSKYPFIANISLPSDPHTFLAIRKQVSQWADENLPINLEEICQAEMSIAFHFIKATLDTAHRDPTYWVKYSHSQGATLSQEDKVRWVNSRFESAEYDGIYFSFVSDNSGLWAVRQTDFDDKLIDRLAPGDYSFLIQNGLIPEDMSIRGFMNTYFSSVRVAITSRGIGYRFW